MILARNEPYCKNITLSKTDFDSESWEFLSKILEFPVNATFLSFTVGGYMQLPRDFENEQPGFIPVDTKSILGKVD